MLSIRNGVEEKNKFRLSIIDLQLIYSIHTQCFLLFLICKVLVSIIRDHSANNCSHLINTSLTKNVNANSWNLHDHMHYLVYSYLCDFYFFFSIPPQILYDFHLVRKWHALKNAQIQCHAHSEINREFEQQRNREKASKQRDNNVRYTHMYRLS